MEGEEIVKVFEKHGMNIDLGATYSAKGQIAQLINGANALMLKGCKWKNEEGEGYFHTECGYDYALMDGTLEDNEHNYCPKCGGMIVEI
jgi:hypothetical protein